MKLRRLVSSLAVLAVAVVIPFSASLNAPDASAQPDVEYYREVSFDTAEVVTADEQSGSFEGFAPATLGAFAISCTEDSGTATLDVAIQRTVDGGSTWADIVAFTQLSATGSETKLYADVRAASAQMIGDVLRVDYDVTGTGQYTCAATAAVEA